MIFDPVVWDCALDEIREKSKKTLYQRDFAAWLWDVLGERMYDKMAEISHDVLFGAKPRTLVKSANGTGKTHSAARWALWWITAFPKEESLAIVTAPTLTQVRMGVWAYLKETYGYVKLSAEGAGKQMPWPGWISEQDEWKYDTPGGNRTLAIARVPGAHDAVSTFQGLRKTGGRNFIVLDEAGGVSRDIYRAIDKLMTSGDSRMAGIGNPDNRGTAFHDRYLDERLMREYQLHTITAYDTPNLTGETVYPDNPEKERLLRSGLVSAQWVFDMERMLKTGGEIVFDEATGAERNLTGEPDGAFKSMVLGQFPDEDDRTLYSATLIQAARELEIPDEDIADAPVILGVDLATTGKDESVVMVNRGGKVRVFDGTVSYDDGGTTRTTTGTWTKEDELTAARRVHAIAKYLGAAEVRVDSAGLGAGIATNLERLPELQVGKTYVVIRISGGERSADADRWANTRAQNHDYLRELMLERKVDIDYHDTALRDQLRVTTYDTNKRGAIQITPKKELRTEMHGSPDRLDALIYSLVDTTPLTQNPLAGIERGARVEVDPWEEGMHSDVFGEIEMPW